MDLDPYSFLCKKFANWADKTYDFNILGHIPGPNYFIFNDFRVQNLTRKNTLAFGCGKQLASFSSYKRKV
jgi:hypothetical protein